MTSKIERAMNRFPGVEADSWYGLIRFTINDVVDLIPVLPFFQRNGFNVTVGGVNDRIYFFINPLQSATRMALSELATEIERWQDENGCLDQSVQWAVHRYSVREPSPC